MSTPALRRLASGAGAAVLGFAVLRAAAPADLPASLTDQDYCALTVMAAYERVTPTEELYKANLAAVSDWLTKHHGFALHPDDLAGIDYVYRTAFFTGGPDLTYNMAGRGARGGFGGGNASTYGELQS